MPSRTLTPSALKNSILLFSFLLIIYLFFYYPSLHAPPRLLSSHVVTANPLTRRHLLFSIASSSSSWPRRRSYVRLWYSPNSTRALTFLDRAADSSSAGDPSLPRIVISADTSKFPFTFPKGLRSAVRVARVVKEAVDLTDEKAGVRWFVFGDDDTVFFVDNLVKTLSKYDDDRWFYVGSNSEGYEQNAKHSFGMAFGGGGFAISHSLARVLAGALDSCLMRYAHLYGSDARVFSCLVELGVGLTPEPGFHQIRFWLLSVMWFRSQTSEFILFCQLDMRGDMFGMLSAHPLSPLLSLHHLDAIDPIFPNMNRTQALQHLFKAVNVDPARILQQTVCYDQSSQLTVSVAWGFAVQVYEGNQLLPDLLSLQRTFTSWRRGSNVESHFMFNLRDYPRDPCKRPIVFFLESVLSHNNSVQSNYVKHVVGNCAGADVVRKIEKIRVFSEKLELDVEEAKLVELQSFSMSSVELPCCVNYKWKGEEILMALKRFPMVGVHFRRKNGLEDVPKDGVKQTPANLKWLQSFSRF
ncbi:hypothetical protein WN943_010978 [Citrus x changshan-huyou]